MVSLPVAIVLLLLRRACGPESKLPRFPYTLLHHPRLRRAHFLTDLRFSSGEPSARRWQTRPRLSPSLALPTRGLLARSVLFVGPFAYAWSDVQDAFLHTSLALHTRFACPLHVAALSFNVMRAARWGTALPPLRRLGHGTPICLGRTATLSVLGARDIACFS